jgi:ribosome hibernation promoting factor
MKVTTTARHCELDPEVRTFVQQRLERLLRYFRDPRDLMEAHVVVAAEKYRHSAEVTLKLRHGEFVGREQADEPRTAIDLAAGRIEAQIRREKGKRLDRKRTGRVRVPGAPADATPAPAEEADEIAFDDAAFDEVGDRPENGGPGRLPMEE